MLNEERHRREGEGEELERAVGRVEKAVGQLGLDLKSDQANIVAALGTVSNDLIQQQKQLDKILEIIQQPTADGIAIQFGKQIKEK